MLLDATVALLLFITIVYCWKLSKKIAALNTGKKELEAFIKEFNTAIKRAEESINALKTLGRETDATLHEHIEKARFLANDLSFLLHKGSGLADKLEIYIAAANHAADPNPMALRGSRAASPATQFPVKPPEAQNRRQTSRGTQEMTPSKRHALDTVLAQISSKRKNSPARSSEENTGNAREQNKRTVSSVRQSVAQLRASVEVDT